MKIRRVKNFRQTFSFFKRSFGFRVPYQIIVDGTFLRAALESDCDLVNSLESLFDGQVKLFTTECIIKELKSAGNESRAAVQEARKMEKLRCTHADPVSSSQCLTEIVGETNKFKYLIATQDRAFNKKIRSSGYVPVLFMANSIIFIEPLTEENKRRGQEIEQNKLLPRPFEIPIKKDTDEKPRRRSRPKGPNPLSVKRKKPKPKTQHNNPPSTGKKRKRRNKKKVANLTSQA